jgi:hypothetical protein
MNITGVKQYSQTDQERFAALSGDFNPVHINSETSRRELFGEVVVHGVHLVLSALNFLSASRAAAAGIQINALKVKFFSPALLSRELTFSINDFGTQLKIDIRDVKQQLLTAMDISYSEPDKDLPAPAVLPDAFQAAAPEKLAIADINGISGSVPLCLNRSLCAELFPNLLDAIPITQVAELLSYTHIVGMKCPGLQSLFSGIDVKSQPTSAVAVAYRADQVIQKFSIISLGVTGPTLQGTLSTLFRPAVTQQPSFEEVASHVIPGSFKGMKALVIGGSRGIGETTAKIIAAGGGIPVITYYMGEQEAQAICSEINGAGLDCSQLRLSIRDIKQTLADVLPGSGINAIFYYATPRIVKSSVLDLELFHNFNFYYIDQFDTLVNAAKTHLPHATIFYPSTVAIDEKNSGLKEYVMSKIAGEHLCGFYNRDTQNIAIIVQRLPRLETDQTLNLQNYPAQSVIEVMQPLIEKMYRRIQQFSA